MWFIAEEKERLIGIGILGSDKPGSCAEIVSIFVDRDWRRRGLGGALMQCLEREVRARELQALYVGSNENANAVGFYRSAGFEIVCLMDPSVVWIPGLETTITMAKRL